MSELESLNYFLGILRQTGDFLKLEATQDFLNRVPNMHIFTLNNEQEVLFNHNTGKICQGGLNLPFENCWFNIKTINVTTTGTDNIELSNGSMGVWEVEPNLYRVISAVEIKDKGLLPFVFSIQPDGHLGLGTSSYPEDYVNVCRLTYGLLLHVIESINTRPMTLVENTDTAEFKGRIGRVYTKVKCKPSYTIFLQSESSIRKTNPNLAHKIISEPNYAFEVRGHWRKLLKSETLGKNRQSERVVKGFTWVTPFTKGHGELIRKVRVVKGDK